MDFSSRDFGNTQTRCFQCLFMLVLIEIVLGIVLTMLGITLVVFMTFEKESFLHVFGFLEGVLAVIAGIVGLLATRKKYLKMTRPWLTTHAMFAAVCLLLLVIDSAAVTPHIIRTVLLSNYETTQQTTRQTTRHLAGHTLAVLYLATLVIHVALLLALCISSITSLVNLRVCSQKGRYDTTATSTNVTDMPEIERL